MTNTKKDPKKPAEDTGAELVDAPEEGGEAGVIGQVRSEIAERGRDDLRARETHKGLPVMDADEYQRFYGTDTANTGEEAFTTFDFQGFVRLPEGNLIYKDSMATNGLLKAEGHEGIHVGTDGIVDYGAMMQNHKMQGPEEIGEYDIYITIPTELQKERGVVCQYDSCRSVIDYQESWDADEEEVREAQGRGEGWVVIRTSLNPKRDKGARQKAQEPFTRALLSTFQAVGD